VFGRIWILRSLGVHLRKSNGGIGEKLFWRVPCSCPYDAWGGSLFAFPCHPLECSAIQIAASCSVINPLITSVSPSGHRISIPQPVPGFLRAMNVGRCSNIRRICAHGTQVQASNPATIPRSADGRDRPSTPAGNTGNHCPNKTLGTVGCAIRRGANRSGTASACPPCAGAVSFGTRTRLCARADRLRKRDRDCAVFRHESSLRSILAMPSGSRASSGPTRASSGLTPRAGPLAVPGRFVVLRDFWAHRDEER
jgi:hypothetical protein